MTLISANQLHLAFGDASLLDGVNFTILAGQKIGLVGRNGCGKSSLLKLLNGDMVTDQGDLSFLTGLQVAYIAQEQNFNEQNTVYEILGSALGDIFNIYVQYQQNSNSDLAHLLDEANAWDIDARIQTYLDLLGMQANQLVGKLSGGQKKRLGIMQALIQKPDFLLLDEPTNHLDILGIQWLESYLKQLNIGFMVISHDRHFLNAITDVIFELDRGKITIFEGNFYYYQARKQELLEIEKVSRAKFDKLLEQEEIWIRKGVEARRTKSQARIERLVEMRDTKEAQRKQTGLIKFSVAKAEASGKVIAELEDVCLSYPKTSTSQTTDKNIIQNFNVRILRGDKIGIIGPNGIGKTSLVKLILGKIAPTHGKIKQGMHLEIAYFDQMREFLDPNKTLADTISPGSEWIMINNQRKHVIAYLNDFLFSSKRANSFVGNLSGGEKNRLLLARLFAKPSNVLVLDEPSNDLDIPTLELLEDKLIDYTGTLFLISHDRSFVNQIVNSIIAPELPNLQQLKPQDLLKLREDFNGQWHRYFGNYDDWQMQSASNKIALPTEQTQKNSKDTKDYINPKESEKTTLVKSQRAIKLSFKQKQRLAQIPQLIESLEQSQQQLKLNLDLAYKNNAKDAHILAIDYANQEENLLNLLQEWEDLEAVNSNSNS